MNRPNILFLMTDQMQGGVLAPEHPCKTPNLDRLASEGIRFRRAYTPNAVCSPARASLMTGLLPHNHGVQQVTHCGDPDQNVLRTDREHWAQILQRAGYRTGYFGKWHVDHANDPRSFGWSVTGEAYGNAGNEGSQRKSAPHKSPNYSLAKYNEYPLGYRKTLLYGITDIPLEQRGVGIQTHKALQFLDEALDQAEPWCCFVSVIEPHDPFVCGEKAWALYDVDNLELPSNANDDLAGRPGLYRKSAKVWKGMTARERKEAMACYYASITEIDEQFGKLLDKVRQSGSADNTIVVFTSDHGELLGSHGLYVKNIGAFEEVYHIPLIMAGPGIERGKVSGGRVGLHDLYPTLLELTSCAAAPVEDSRSFVPVLQNIEMEMQFTTGYSEYFGGRVYLTQRVVWDDNWKYVFNGFDEDELYNLSEDPGELRNLIELPEHEERVKRMCRLMWQRIAATGDHVLLNSNYASLRLASYGPDI